MRLIIVRHGETEQNIQGLAQGQTHGDLTEYGIEQARQVAERLRDIPLDVIYASDLRRVVDTTKEITRHHPDVPVHYTTRLREFTKGKLDGKPREEIDRRKKEITQSLHTYRWEGGESFLDVHWRVKQCLQDVHARHDGETVLMVSHGGPIKCLLLHLLGESFEQLDRYKVQNTAISVIDFEERNLRFERLNCIKHLD